MFVGKKSNTNLEEKCSKNSPNKNKKNIYIQKMIPRNENLHIASTGENIQNVRTNLEDIFFQ